jgi:hypothetical protein
VLELAGCILLLILAFIALRFVSAGLGALTGKVIVAIRRLLVPALDSRPGKKDDPPATRGKPCQITRLSLHRPTKTFPARP